MKPQIKEVNVETGEEIVRDATTAEIKQMEKDAAEWSALLAAKEQQNIERTALLQRLGLTENEAKILLS